MKPHAHPGRELYLHVMEGNGTFFIDEETVEIETGDVIYCDPEEKLASQIRVQNPSQFKNDQGRFKLLKKCIGYDFNARDFMVCQYS